MAEYKRSTIYTKTGDAGLTSLFNGDRLPKDDSYFDALGAVDEANSVIGMIDAMYDWNLDRRSTIYEIKAMLANIQCRLLDVGSHVATPLTHSSTAKIKRVEFEEEDIGDLERMIDKMDAQLPRLTNFILPSGIFHLARVNVRKAERHVVRLVREGNCSEAVLRYLNRLSDFFFVLARYTSKEETVYKKSSNKGAVILDV